jgi:acyl-CoA synthetase (AMP-forming)/AMP-acid ligase II
MNIVEPILFQCRLNPLAIAICVPGSIYGSINYETLDRFIRNTAQTAVSSGIAPGSVVAIYVNDSVLHASLILGLMHAGAATLSLREPKQISGIVPDIILTDAPGRFSSDVTVLAIDRSWLDGDGATPSSANSSRGSDGDICRIILTSGSTGVSKGVAFSHKELAARIAHYTYSKGPRFAHCPRFFCDLGISTSPGFRYAMSLLSRGGTIYFLGPDPTDILQTIDLHKIQGMATSPYGLAEFLKFFEADSAFEVTFDHIICQGAMLSRELSYRARARMCQNLYSSYGSTETTTVAFGPASVIENVSGAVGYIQPGVTVEAVDKSGNVLPPLRDGALRIRTAHMATGYVGDPAATQTFFRGGYFYSGDIGHVTPQGLLVVTGREKTALNIGGDTIHPELVEEVIVSFEGIREAGAFAVDNDLGIAELSALIVTTAPIDEIALRNHCATRLRPSAVPVKFIIVDALPRGGQGKLERSRLPEIAISRANGIDDQ